MSENKGMNEWLKDWDALQRQYFNAWSDLAQKAPFSAQANAMPAGFPGGHPFAVPASPGFPPGISPFGGFAGAAPNLHGVPWQEGLEQWMRLFAGSDPQSETVERLIEGAKAYVAMMQSLFGGVPPMAEGAANPAQVWFDTARSGFGAASIPGFDPATSPFARALREVAGKGVQGFTELPAAFAPYLEQMRQQTESWLRMPAFGIAREHQEHYQRTALALVEYQQALREYNRLMLKASQRGNELFERKLAEHGEPGRTIDSLKALYDLWVDAAEEAYAEVALSEEFSKAYGELANAQMRLRKQIQADAERVSREFGMPTRSELDSLGKRVHDLGRELRGGGAAARGDGEFGEEIAALRGEVAALKKSLSRVAVKNPAMAKSTVPAGAAAKAETPFAKNPEPASKPARSRTPRRTAAPKPRAPAAVVRPRPTAETEEPKPSSKAASFEDALAAMRRRIAGRPKKLRAAASQLARPSKGEKADRKRDRKDGKRK